jgi:hypothetical protein
LKLPEGFHFLEYEGRTIFPCGTASGGIGSTLVAVIIQKDPEASYVGDFGRASMGVQERAGGRWHVVEMNYSDSPQIFQEKVDEAIKALLV